MRRAYKIMGLVLAAGVLGFPCVFNERQGRELEMVETEPLPLAETPPVVDYQGGFYTSSLRVDFGVANGRLNVIVTDVQVGPNVSSYSIGISTVPFGLEDPFLDLPYSGTNGLSDSRN